MSVNVFLDTNVLVYAIEVGGPQRGKHALALALTRRRDLCTSTQVLGEFYRAVTSVRRAVPLTHDEAVAWIRFWKRFDLCHITLPHMDLALELTGRFQISYYDALILAAANLAKCEIVYSEDLNAGQSYAGVTVVNPFF